MSRHPKPGLLVERTIYSALYFAISEQSALSPSKCYLSLRTFLAYNWAEGLFCLISPSDLRDKTAHWKFTGSGFPCNYGPGRYMELNRRAILSNIAFRPEGQGSPVEVHWFRFPCNYGTGWHMELDGTVILSNATAERRDVRSVVLQPLVRCIC